MKLANATDRTLCFGDINLVMVYDRSQEGTEIDDSDIATSKLLQQCIIDDDVIILEADETTTFYKSIISRKLIVDENKIKVTEEKESDDGFVKDERRNHINDYTPDRNTSSRLKYLETGIADVSYHGPILDYGGYARMNRYYALELAKKKNINLRIDPMDSRPDVEPEVRENILSHNASIGEDAIRIFGCTAPYFNWGGYKVLYTMMETRHSHEQYVDRCNHANELWVPSKWCIESFRESGVRSDMHYMPIGVDFDIYNETKQPLDFGGKVGGFVFVSVFGWSMRKGYDVLLKSYLEEFSGKDDVTLLISSRYFGSIDEDKKQIIRNDIERVSNSVKKKDKPRVVLFGDLMPDEMMGNLYNTCHCYVCPSRGEGFGLPPLEASMCGLPVISSCVTGLSDFIREDNSYIIPHSGWGKQPDINWISFFYEDQELAQFDDNSIQATMNHMRNVYENYDKAKVKNRKLQKFIRENYSWKTCIERAEDRIMKIYKKLSEKGE